MQMIEQIKKSEQKFQHPSLPPLPDYMLEIIFEHEKVIREYLLGLDIELYFALSEQEPKPPAEPKIAYTAPLITTKGAPAFAIFFSPYHFPPEYLSTEEGKVWFWQVLLHELGHVLAYLEENLEDLKMAFRYLYALGQKVLQDPQNPTKIQETSGLFATFRNWIEDVIVNQRKLQTSKFNPKTSQWQFDLAKSNYWQKLFPLEVNGSLISEKDIEERGLILEDSNNNYTIRKSGRLSFLSWLILVPFFSTITTRKITPDSFSLVEDDKGEVNPIPGRILLKGEKLKDVYSAFFLPLDQAYSFLLRRVLDKLQTLDKEKARIFAHFLISEYHVLKEDENGEIIVHETIPNVVDKNLINLIISEETFVGNIKSLTDEQKDVIIRQATLHYRIKIRELIPRFNPSEENFYKLISYISHHYPEIARSNKPPVVFNYYERLRIYAWILDPLITLLAMLDGIFPTDLPDHIPVPPKKNGDNGRGKRGKREDRSIEQGPVEKTWKIGDWVVDNREGPNKGRLGVITEVQVGPDGKIIRVSVQWTNDKVELSMSQKINIYGQKQEWIDDPDDKLLVYAPGKGIDGPRIRVRDKRKYWHPKEEEQEITDREGKRSESDEEKSQDSSRKSPKEIQEESERGLGEKLNDILEELRDIIDSWKRSETLKEVEKQQQSPEHKEALRNKEKREKRFDEMRKKVEEDAEKKGRILIDKETAEKYFELIDKFRPKIEQEVDEIVKNLIEIMLQKINEVVLQKEITFKGKRINPKRFVKEVGPIYPSIQAGEEIDLSNKRIWESLREQEIIRIKPRALRITIIFDISGSMMWLFDTIHFCNLFFNILFARLNEKLREITGACFYFDWQAIPFSENAFIAKDFKVEEENLQFLREEKEYQMPPPQTSDEIDLETFQVANYLVPGGGTNDLEAWQIVLQRAKKVGDLLENKKLTWIVIQLTDGDIWGTNKETVEKIGSELSDLGVHKIGFVFNMNETAREYMQHRFQYYIQTSSIDFASIEKPDVCVELEGQNPEKEFLKAFKSLIKKIAEKAVEKFVESIEITQT